MYNNQNIYLKNNETEEVKRIKKKIILVLCLYYIVVLLPSCYWNISYTEGPFLYGKPLLNYLGILQFIFVFVMLYVVWLTLLGKLKLASYILLTVAFTAMFILIFATEGNNLSYMFLLVCGATAFALLQNKQALPIYLTASMFTLYIGWFFHDFAYEASFNLFICVVLSTSLYSVVNYTNSITIRKLTFISGVDVATGLLNRSVFNDILNSEVLNNRTQKVLMICDLDHFKKINDTYGHDVGDEAIKAFANCLKENIRDTDVAFRWGGEEFVVLMQGKVDENIDVYNILDRLRENVEEMDIDGVPQFTVSIGYCNYDSNVDVKKLIKQADLALYKAKRTGRNKVFEYKAECQMN